MPYIVPTKETPTLWNRNAALGALIGSIFFPIVGTAIGGAIGGYIGKSRMEDELRNGKTVKEPSFWNMKTAIGALLGKFGGGIAGALVGFTIGLFTVPFLPICTSLGIFVGAVAGLGFGLFKGGNDGKAEMEQNYRAAQLAQGISNGKCAPVKEKPLEFNNPVREKQFAPDICAKKSMTPAMGR